MFGFAEYYTCVLGTRKDYTRSSRWTRVPTARARSPVSIRGIGGNAEPQNRVAGSPLRAARDRPTPDTASSCPYRLCSTATVVLWNRAVCRALSNEYGV